MSAGEIAVLVLGSGSLLGLALDCIVARRYPRRALRYFRDAARYAGRATAGVPSGRPAVPVAPRILGRACRRIGSAMGCVADSERVLDAIAGREWTTLFLAKEMGEAGALRAEVERARGRLRSSLRSRRCL